MVRGGNEDLSQSGLGCEWTVARRLRGLQRCERRWRDPRSAPVFYYVAGRFIDLDCVRKGRPSAPGTRRRVGGWCRTFSLPSSPCPASRSGSSSSPHIPFPTRQPVVPHSSLLRRRRRVPHRPARICEDLRSASALFPSSHLPRRIHAAYTPTGAPRESPITAPKVSVYVHYRRNSAMRPESVP